jgi:hypothetical protein
MGPGIAAMAAMATGNHVTCKASHKRGCCESSQSKQGRDDQFPRLKHFNIPFWLSVSLVVQNETFQAGSGFLTGGVAATGPVGLNGPHHLQITID